MAMTSSVDSSQCSMAMVSINENDVNDKTDCSGKRVTLRQWSRFVWYYMVFHGHELLWYYRNYSVSAIKDDFLEKGYFSIQKIILQIFLFWIRIHDSPIYGRLELFRKFIRFGGARLPLPGPVWHSWYSFNCLYLEI